MADSSWSPSGEDDDSGGDGDGGADVDDAGDDVVFDPLCSLCDDGGEMLWCEGKCLRSFHPTVESGEDAGCVSLGMSSEEVEAINPFYCENCTLQEHQCFVCGQLGSSDVSSDPKVFLCSNATCGHFYHPLCVAKLLHPTNYAEQQNLEQKIAAGKAFTCPAHQCYVCKGGENKKDANLRFAVCRRCPRAYHSKCLPLKIIQSELRRTWEGIIPGRILIYCLKHKIVEEIGTPMRDHIRFPNRRSRVFLSSEKRDLEGKPQQAVQIAQSIDKMKLGSCSTSPLSPTNKQDTKYGDACRFYMTDKPKLLQVKSAAPSTQKPNDVSLQTITQSKPAVSTIDHEEIRTRMKALLKASSATSMEDFMQRQSFPSTHSYSKNLCKDITLGKVEGSVQAVEAALQKLEEGASIEDAKAICEPEILTQIIKWKTKLNVYLGPLLYGPRYTPFGRHFTKLSKMHEVVDLLHWYVQSGDMVVDFCCGSNDFSLLMKKKLEENQKNCLFKNYDLVRPRNDFEFEKKDWMKVEQSDLADGSKLVMGLNPPYGVDGQLANLFIIKALRFKPKLMILIVPEKSKKLHRDHYKLIWEDGEMFHGEAFYLPGVINDKGEQAGQYNIDPPHLYLWSRGDWAQKHFRIARQQGHSTKHHTKLRK